MDYELLKGLSYKGWASMNMRTTKTRMFLPQVATGVVWTSKYANQSTDATSDQFSLQTENKLVFIKDWNRKHNLIANLLVRTSQTQNPATQAVHLEMPRRDYLTLSWEVQSRVSALVILK